MVVRKGRLGLGRGADGSLGGGMDRGVGGDRRDGDVHVLNRCDDTVANITLGT